MDVYFSVLLTALVATPFLWGFGLLLFGPSAEKFGDAAFSSLVLVGLCWAALLFFGLLLVAVYLILAIWGLS